MANVEKVTVDKAYFDALLRRADFHTSARHVGRTELANVTVPRVEYDSLLQAFREFKLLKEALFQGGIRSETLDLLISGAGSNDRRKDSGVSVDEWTENSGDQPPFESRVSPRRDVSGPRREVFWQTDRLGAPFDLAPGHGTTTPQTPHVNLEVPAFHRHPSYGFDSSSADVAGLDNENIGDDVIGANAETSDVLSSADRHTLFMSGLSDRTTYRDLISVMKGGKLLNVNLRSDRTAVVSFFEGSAEFLAWAKRNDIYLDSKRIEVKWAERQYRVNGHIRNKILNGATRNIVIHSALAKGLTESQIRDDMEHIHNLLIISVTFRHNGDAYVSTNSIHNALFARTCMLSRTTYKGCKIEFYRDECDVPLPARQIGIKPRMPKPTGKKESKPPPNRFDMLNGIGMDGSSAEEACLPEGNSDTDERTVNNMPPNLGAILNFLDSDPR